MRQKPSAEGWHGRRVTSLLQSGANQLAAHFIQRQLDRACHGRLQILLPGGKCRTFNAPSGPQATFRLHDQSFWRRVLMGGEMALGETYVEGLWDSDDLVGLLEYGSINRAQMALNASSLSWPARLRNARRHQSRRNTRETSRDNINAHYDIGNDFYRLWLDEEMNYSAGIFLNPEEGLEDAQANKHRIVCEKLALREGHEVLDIGCGWGAHAFYSARNYGSRVTGITISHEQLSFASERVRQLGLDDSVEISFCDYRNARGQYDRVVSIGMLEHVGAEYFEHYFRAVERLLKPGGRAMIQAISVPDRRFAANRAGTDWVQRYIFPGGVLPSIAAIERALSATNLLLLDVEDIGQHFGLTMHHWRERFLKKRPLLESRGYDQRFIRTWDYFLAACEAGFRTRNQSDIQFVLEKPPHSTGLRRIR